MKNSQIASSLNSNHLSLWSCPILALNFGSLIFLEASRWRLINNCPEDAEFFYCIHELVEIDRLHHIRVHAKFVARYQVPLLARRGENDYRNHPQFLVLFNRLENLQTISFWQFQIEQYDCGIITAASLKLSPVIQVIESLLTIHRHYDLIGQVIFFQRCHGELHIFRIIFHEQNATHTWHNSAPTALLLKCKRSRPHRPATLPKRARRDDD